MCVPFQSAIFDDPPCLRLEIRDQVLVLHLEHRALGQDGTPMLHQQLVRPVIAREFAEIVGKFEAVREQIGIARETRIYRIAAQMDDVRVGKRQMNEANEAEIGGQLVGDTIGLRREAANARDILACKPAQLFARKRGKIERKSCARLARGDELQHVRQLAGAEDAWMAGQNLLDQRGTRARHAHDEDRQVAKITQSALRRDQF